MTRTRTTLTAIATQMREIVEQTGARYAHRRLNRGLEIMLMPTTTMDNQWRLAVARKGAPPSEHELEAVEAAFSVPDGSEWKRRMKRQRAQNGRDSYTTELHVAEVFWVESGVRSPES